MRRLQSIRTDFEPDRLWSDHLQKTYEIVVPVVRREARTGTTEAAARRRRARDRGGKVA